MVCLSKVKLRHVFIKFWELLWTFCWHQDCNVNDLLMCIWIKDGLWEEEIFACNLIGSEEILTLFIFVEMRTGSHFLKYFFSTFLTLLFYLFFLAHSSLSLFFWNTHHSSFKRQIPAYYGLSDDFYAYHIHWYPTSVL